MNLPAVAGPERPRPPNSAPDAPKWPKLRAWCSFSNEKHEKNIKLRHFGFKINPRRSKIAKNASVVLVLTRKAPTNYQIMFNSVPKPLPDASKTHPCRRIHPSDIKNRSVALLFATRNAPLSRISHSGPPKCERGARFCIPKRTLIANFASRMSKVRAWSHFCAPTVHLSQVLRLGHPKYTNTQTQIHTQTHNHTNMQTCKHDAKYSSIVGSCNARVMPV